MITVSKSKQCKIELVITKIKFVMAIVLIIFTIIHLVKLDEIYNTEIEPYLEECEVIGSAYKGVDNDTEVVIHRLSNGQYYVLSVGSNWNSPLFICTSDTFKSYNTMITFNDDGTVYTTLGNFKNSYHKVEYRLLDMQP